MSRELVRALERVADRFRTLRLWTALALLWLACAAAGWGYAALMWWTRPDGRWITAPALAAWLAALALAGLLVATLARRSVRDLRWVARRIEAAYPDLRTGLLAAVEESAQPGSRSYLGEAVLRQALAHRASHDWGAAVSPRALAAAKTGHLVALALLASVTLALGSHLRSTAPGLGLMSPTTAAAGGEVQVDPGDAEVERGTSLLVVARFPAGAVPAEAALVVDDDGAAGRPMSRSLEDPTFAGRVEPVEADFAYRVAYGDRSTRSYRVTVFEYPAVLRTDATLKFPAYTGLESKCVEDVRHVTAVEGTELTVTAHLNKEVASAALVDEEGGTVPLTSVENNTNAVTATLTLAESRRYEIRLVDRDGRSSKTPATLAVNVTRNRPPTVTLTRPGRDTRVSPVEELALQAKLADDYGVVRHGLTWTLAGGEPKEVALGTNAAGTKGVVADHLLAFEALKAEPDQLVNYFFWAEDIAPDGTPRRAEGDLFFAEVRHFEEIFRQGEGQPGGAQPPQGQGGGGNGQQAEQLAELQKQVINATWTLIRRETGATPAPTLAADAKAVEDAQNAAIEQATALGEKLNDRESQGHLARATKAMTEAARNLAEAGKGPAAAPLTPALAAAQGAYQALLKLRAREFEVTRQNRNQQQGGGGGGGGAQRQAQLDELELSDEQNRFEQRSSARSAEGEQQRETRQVLNRLAELARRQGDLNDRLKELQAALEAAKDEAARQEVERQLKRLREQEGEILRDADELRERMEREENRDRMADARQALEQSRERMRQAAEALENGQVPQAITEGARAGRELDDLREELRKNSSDRFGADLAEMREQARKLDERQEELTRQLEGGARPDARPALRDAAKDQAREGLRDQARQLDELTDRMRQTVEEAEESEPLLARNLFDAARRAGDGAINKNLIEAEKLADAGFSREAADASRKAGEALDGLRQGVEEAARSVLGDETAALQRARDELDDLTRQVERELAQAGGEATPPGEQAPPGRGEPDVERKGQPADGPGADAERPGQGQPGEPAEKGKADDQPGAGARQAGEAPGQGGEARQPGQGQQPGEGQQQGGGQGQPQPGQGQGERSGQGQRGGPQQAGQPGGRGGSPQGGSPRGGGSPGGLERLLDGLDPNAGGAGAPGGPITGDGFRAWTDRMRDVEDLLQDPALRAEAARIRDRVRGAREEFRRHAKEPDPAAVQSMIAAPIRELRDRVTEEVRRRESPDALVPIDRDPVPPRFAEGVRRYYERLGSGR
jgi:hypothetical protein